MSLPSAVRVYRHVIQVQASDQLKKDNAEIVVRWIQQALETHLAATVGPDGVEIVQASGSMTAGWDTRVVRAPDGTFHVMTEQDFHNRFQAAP